LPFQAVVDGWLTKLSAPIVIYNEQHSTGIRFPFDIPVEDFLFGLVPGDRGAAVCGRSSDHDRTTERDRQWVSVGSKGLQREQVPGRVRRRRPSL